MHIDDLKQVLPQLGFDYSMNNAERNWQDLCPACKRKDAGYGRNCECREELRG